MVKFYAIRSSRLHLTAALAMSPALQSPHVCTKLFGHYQNPVPIVQSLQGSGFDCCLSQAMTSPTQLSRKLLWTRFNIRSLCFVCPARQAESYALQQLKTVKLHNCEKSYFSFITSEEVTFDTFKLVSLA
jgi:hypothetical protein